MTPPVHKNKTRGLTNPGCGWRRGKAGPAAREAVRQRQQRSPGEAGRLLLAVVGARPDLRTRTGPPPGPLAHLTGDAGIQCEQSAQHVRRRRRDDDRLAGRAGHGMMVFGGHRRRGAIASGLLPRTDSRRMGRYHHVMAQARTALDHLLDARTALVDEAQRLAATIADLDSLIGSMGGQDRLAEAEEP